MAFWVGSESQSLQVKLIKNLINRASLIYNIFQDCEVASKFTDYGSDFTLCFDSGLNDFGNIDLSCRCIKKLLKITRFFKYKKSLKFNT